MKVPTADKAEQTHQGMFSGHRGTSFDNTMLNIGYFNTAASAVANRWGVLPEPLHRVDTGDDIWFTNHNVVWAALVYDQMVASGLVLQPVKQLFSTRSEFLRILYTREGISGYLCRSIVSWTTSSIQDTAGLDIVTRVEEADTIMSTLYRRGALVEPLMRLRDMVVARVCRIKTTDDKGSSRYVVLEVDALKSPYALGGIDHGYPGDSGVICRKKRDIPRLGAVAPEKARDLPYHMAADQAERDRSAMQISDASPNSLQDMYREQNSSGCAFPSEIEEIRVEYAKSLAAWSRARAGLNRRRQQTKTRRELSPLCEHDQLVQFWVNRPHDKTHDQTFSQYIPEAHDWPHPTPVEALDRAIRVSPFRDLTTVKRLFCGSSIDLLCKIVHNIRDDADGARAANALAQFRLCLSDADVVRVIGGMRTDGPTIGWLLPPVMQSYLSGVIGTAVMDSRKYTHRMTLEEWGKEVQFAPINAMSFVAKHTLWIKVCGA